MHGENAGVRCSGEVNSSVSNRVMNVSIDNTTIISTHGQLIHCLNHLEVAKQ